MSQISGQPDASLPLAYPYRPLTGSELRLWAVTPRRDDNDTETIRCALYQVPLDITTKFVALSYTWGDPTNPKEISLNGQPFKVTASLHSALEMIREEMSQDDMFWIDAICINQQDIDEKSVQVPRMADIYGKADSVLAWLGKNGESDGADARNKELFELAKRVNTYVIDEMMKNTTGFDMVELCCSYPGTVGTESFTEEYMTVEIARLLERGWFSRIWIVQEAVLPSLGPVFYAGRWSIDLSALKQLTVFLAYRIKDKKRLLLLDDRWLLRSLMVMSLRCFDLKETVDSDQRLAEVILEMLSETRNHQATVPHDRLYGLWGIFQLALSPNYTPPTSLLPNYRQSFSTLFHEYSKFIIQQTGDLRVLDCQTKNLPDDVPSWVPDFRSLSMTSGQTTPYTKAIAPAVSPDGLALTLQGTMIDTCELVLPYVSLPSRRTVSMGYLQERISVVEGVLAKAAKWRGVSIETIRVEFFSQPDWSEFDLDRVYQRFLEAGDHASLEKDPSADLFPTLASFLTCQLCISSKGYIIDVLFDHTVEIARGDTVWLFLGGLQPYVLRGEGDSARYKLLGHANVFGVDLPLREGVNRYVDDRCLLDMKLSKIEIV